MTLEPDFRFSGPGGVIWTHRVRTYTVGASYRPEYLQEDEAGYSRHLLSAAARELSEKIIRDQPWEYGDGPPSKVNPWDTMKTKLWRVSVVMPDDKKNYFSDQMDEQERQGLRKAAELVERHAGRYTSASGACANAIRHALMDAARELRTAGDTPLCLK